jgi:hypothetical protein
VRVLLLAVLATLLFVQTAAAEETPTSIGVSQGGEPLLLYRLGDGAKRVLVLGGQHGWPERNTVQLAEAILEHFSGPGELPQGIGLDVVPVANPDGMASGSRQFRSGVDPNRNWGGSDWRADAFDSNARYREGLGGHEPFSEPETIALANWVLEHRPAFVVNYHSAGGFMFGPRDGLPGELARTYADISGYAWPNPTAGGGSPLSYRASGSMNVWLRESGIPALLIELTSPSSPEIDRNIRALRAVLQQLAEAP